MRASALLSIAALSGLSSAHFVLKYPSSIGFSDDDESKSPCGGFTPDFSSDKVVDFHVGGEAIAVRSTHEQANWLLRVTTDQKAASGWEQIFPIVQQSGLGDYCQPKITLNESYVGKKGVVSVVCNAPDGLLYQCIAANFVSGSASAPSECTNASSAKISRTSDSTLSALVSGNSSSDSSATPTKSSTSSTSTTSSSASSSQSGNAATALQAWSVTGLGNVVAALSMMAVGGALMI